MEQIRALTKLWLKVRELDKAIAPSDVAGDIAKRYIRERLLVLDAQLCTAPKRIFKEDAWALNQMIDRLTASRRLSS